MTKRIREYKQKLDSLLNEDSADTDWKSIEEEMLIKTGFFQHERLVHLIVTMTVAILMIISFLTTLIITNIPAELIALIGLLIILTAAYIIHYYKLENAIQDLYKYYDKVRERKAKPQRLPSEEPPAKP